MYKPSKPNAPLPKQSVGRLGRMGGVVRSNASALQSLASAGIPGFKCFLIHSGIDGFAWVDEADLRLALAQLRGAGLPLLVHAELGGPVNCMRRRAEAW